MLGHLHPGPPQAPGLITSAKTLGPPPSLADLGLVCLLEGDVVVLPGGRGRQTQGSQGRLPTYVDLGTQRNALGQLPVPAHRGRAGDFLLSEGRTRASWWLSW